MPISPVRSPAKRAADAAAAASSNAPPGEAEVDPLNENSVKDKILSRFGKPKSPRFESGGGASSSYASPDSNHPISRTNSGASKTMPNKGSILNLERKDQTLSDQRLHSLQTYSSQSPTISQEFTDKSHDS